VPSPEVFAAMEALEAATKGSSSSRPKKAKGALSLVSHMLEF
jgi:hypothetical protein